MPSRIPPLALAVVLAASGTACLFAQAPSGKNLLIEAEEFQMQSNWFVLQQGECSNKQGLQAGSGQLDALTGVTVPEAGTYTVWTRARDFETQQPGTRRYRVILDNEPVGVEAGVHGKEGWRWEKLGTREIAAGDHVLGLRAVTSFARCDAILLTTGDYDPNTVPIRSLARYHVQPKVLSVNDLKEEFLNPPITTRSRRPVGRIGNDRVRIAFSEAEDSAGRTLITRATELFQNGKWEKVPVKENQEALMLIYSAKSSLSTGSWYPFWSNGRKIEFEFGGKKYVTAAGGNPYKAGEVEVLIPRKATVKKGGAIEVGYETASGRKATGVWSVDPGRLDAKLQVTFTADKKGEYSVAFSPFQSWDKEAVAYNFLPPLFNYQRLPAEPKMSVSATMPHALALVETGSGAKYTYGVLADPARLPFDWPTPHNSTYGFSLQTSANKVQPTVFQPILGFEDSKLKPGESKTVSLSVLVQPGDWKAALEYASNQVFNVTDYRRPYGTSLTDAALNMIDLLKDEDHCGWDPKVKGFYNIESQWTASQSSPLAVMSASLLTWDEDLWVKRALPSLEYTLTRPGAHFATKLPKTSPSYVDEKGIKIRVPSDFFGAAYWQGVDDLLGRKNPWTAQYATENGKARYRSSYGSVPRWSEMLGLYRLDPKPELLEQIKKQADTFLKEDVYGHKTNDLGLEPFYNVSFYPYWWDLVDLYEVTHENRYLEAAQEGAFNTIAGLWSQPAVPKSNVTVNPGGDVPAKFTIQWYKGDEKYRLGFPRVAGDLKEHEVPGWLVSRVGLGFEQPCTYYAGGGATFNNIMMSAWAPNLLRVYGYTHREIINTYARNTIIGRFANYPGYYLRVYTDVQTTSQYPYQGPDLTSLYYHHIPVHLAFTLDYLVAEASVRSKGKIDFPWVKQQGYVWFTNRIYGHAPGKIYGDDKMWLRFDRKAIQVKSDQLTYLSAFGANRFDLVLMNESDAPVTSDILLDQAKLGLKEGAPCRVIVNGGEPKSAAFNGKAEVPAKGLVVLSFQAAGKNVPPEIPALKTEPVTQKLSGDWGTLHAFRIRSPFGKDSLYAVLSGHPANGATARLELEGQSEPVPAVDSYPYEFTVYPWPMDREMTFHVVCKDASGTETTSAPITLKP